MGSSSVIPFPAHRRGTLRDTVAGFPGGASTPPAAVVRREQALTMLFVEIRGWPDLALRVGSGPAWALLQRAVGSTVEALRGLGAVDVVIGGEDRRPMASAVFSGPDHPVRAARAACVVRDAVCRIGGRADTRRLHACAGIDTGDVVETVLGAGRSLSYRSAGTVRLFANRLSEFAGPGQIFLSDTSAAALRHLGTPLRSIGAVRTHSGGSTREAFSLGGDGLADAPTAVPTGVTGPDSAAG